MAIVQPEPSDAMKRALAAGVAEFLDRDDPMADLLGKAGEGFRVFTLGLHDIAGGAGIAGAQPAGWRFFAGGENGEAIAGDVIQSGEGPVMTSVSRDKIIAKGIEIAQQLRKQYQAEADRFELRVLRIPGALLEAFWLLSPKGSLMVPFLTRFDELEYMRPYPPEEFFAILRPIAERFLRFDQLEY